VFDVTNKLSFDSLDYWLQEFTSNGGKQAIMAVVGNKVRITHSELIFITCKTDGNFGNVSAGVLFSKVAYQRKGW